MNTNRSGVKENAFANIDKKKFDDNYTHIYDRKNCKCEQCDPDLECRICGKYCVSYPCGKCGYNGTENEQTVQKK